MECRFNSGTLILSLYALFAVHPYHMVTESLAYSNVSCSFHTAIGALCTCMHMYMVYSFNWLISCVILAFWWRDVIRDLPLKVCIQKSSGWNVLGLLFIVSEICFSLDFGLFYSALAPSIVYWLSLATLGIVP
jgi:hypothetical protein